MNIKLHDTYKKHLVIILSDDKNESVYAVPYAELRKLDPEESFEDQIDRDISKQVIDELEEKLFREKMMKNVKQIEKNIEATFNAFK